MFKSIFIKLLVALSIALAISGCANTTSIAGHNLHSKIANNDINIKKILLLPTNILINEDITENISETAPKLTRKTNQIISDATKEYINSKLGIQTVEYAENDMPILLRKYMALINQVVGSIYKHTNSYSWDVWPHKNKQFDYSIGNGLEFLKNENIDAVMIIKGSQHFNVFKENILFEKLYLVASIIDIKTGNILWVDFSEYNSFDIREPNKVVQMLSNVFNSFPSQVLAQSN